MVYIRCEWTSFGKISNDTYPYQQFLPFECQAKELQTTVWISYKLFIRKKKAWHFMWTVCQGNIQPYFL